MSTCSAESHGSALLCDLANSDRRRSASGAAAVCLPTRKWAKLGCYANQTAMVAPGGRNRLTKLAAPSRSASVLGGCCSGRHIKVRAGGCTLHLDCAVCALGEQHCAVGQFADGLWGRVYEPVRAGDLRDIALPVR